jgi:hypothetical protein
MASDKVFVVAGLFVIALGVAVVFKWPGPRESAVGRGCHLEYQRPESLSRRGRSTNELPIARLERDDGRSIELNDGTRCIVLEEKEAKRRIRVTDGVYKGTTGWTTRSAVILEGDRKP